MVEARGNAPVRPADYTWAYQYDEAGNRTRVTDPLGNYIQYAYDAVNNLTQVTDQRGNATEFSYDALEPALEGHAARRRGEGHARHRLHLRRRRQPRDAHRPERARDQLGLRPGRAHDRRAQPRSGPGTRLRRKRQPEDARDPGRQLDGTAGDGTITYGYDRMSRQTSTTTPTRPPTSAAPTTSPAVPRR